MKPYKREIGIVEKRLSRKTYIVQRVNGDFIHVHLQPVHRMNYIELSIGAKIFFELRSSTDLEGRLLTGTDFKLNNWEGWSHEYEP